MLREGMKKQVRLFQGANFIMGWFTLRRRIKEYCSFYFIFYVGGHGAGLSNMLFAASNATIIEFPLKPHVDRCFGHMAMALGFDYWMVPQVSAFYHTNYTMDDERADVVLRLVRHLIVSKHQEEMVLSSERGTLRSQLQGQDSSDSPSLVKPSSISISQKSTRIEPESRKKKQGSGFQVPLFASNEAYIKSIIAAVSKITRC